MKEVLRQSEENYHLMKERGIQAFERMLRKEGVQSFKLAGIQRYRGRVRGIAWLYFICTWSALQG